MARWGYDSFAHEEYTFQGEYATEEARAAAAEHLESIMRLQPKAIWRHSLKAAFKIWSCGAA